MSHTSEAIPASDFIRSNNDIEKEPEIQRESKTFGRMHGHN